MVSDAGVSGRCFFDTLSLRALISASVDFVVGFQMRLCIFLAPGTVCYDTY